MKDILRNHSFSIAFVAILFGSFFLLGDGSGRVQRLNGFTMGTSYQVQLVELPENLSRQELAAAVSELLDELDTGIFSTYAAESELSRFNRHAVESAFTASERLIEVLLLAQEIAQLSGGAFDVTVGPLVNLWGFGPALGPLDSIPDQSQIEAARERVVYRHRHIDPKRT